LGRGAGEGFGVHTARGPSTSAAPNRATSSKSASWT
jgi:hypothetical protein